MEGGVDADVKVEEVLGGVEERSGGVEERRFYGGAPGFGDEGEDGEVGDWDSGYTLESDVVW